MNLAPEPNDSHFDAYLYNLGLLGQVWIRSKNIKVKIRCIRGNVVKTTRSKLIGPGRFYNLTFFKVYFHVCFSAYFSLEPEGFGIDSNF